METEILKKLAELFKKEAKEKREILEQLKKLNKQEMLNKIRDLLDELNSESKMLDELVFLFFDPKASLKSLKDDCRYWADEYVQSDNKDVRDAIIQLIVALNKTYYAALNKNYINLN